MASEDARTVGFGARHAAVRHALLFATIYAMGVWFALRPTHVQDPDLGWHLAAGDWVLRHGTVPLSDPFSIYGQGRSWIAYSWLFEVLISVMHDALGLRAVIIYTFALTVGIVMALHVLLHQLGAGVLRTAILLVLAIIALTPVLTVRPWLITILFFVLTMNALVAARLHGRVWPLACLPPLFAVWANVHIQFTYGFVPVGIYAIEPVMETLKDQRLSWRNVSNSLRSWRWFLVGAVFLATFATPYHYHVYAPFFELVTNTGAFQYVTELHAMDFRNPAHWIVLGLTIAATVVIGRERPAPFWLLLYAFAVVLSFRAVRDTWLILIISMSILAYRSDGASTRFQVVPLTIFVMCGWFAVVSLVMTSRVALGEADLERTLAAVYPASAVRFVEERQYPGPLFNHFDWGGYLIWRLPRLAVSIDGRANLFGDTRVARSSATWNGSPTWADDPELSVARLVIAPADQPLAALLAHDSRFDRVYKDEVAVVFVRDNFAASTTPATAMR